MGPDVHEEQSVLGTSEGYAYIERIKTKKTQGEKRGSETVLLGGEQGGKG